MQTNPPVQTTVGICTRCVQNMIVFPVAKLPIFVPFYVSKAANPSVLTPHTTLTLTYSHVEILKLNKQNSFFFIAEYNFCIHSDGLHRFLPESGFDTVIRKHQTIPKSPSKPIG